MERLQRSSNLPVRLSRECEKKCLSLRAERACWARKEVPGGGDGVRRDRQRRRRCPGGGFPPRGRCLPDGREVPSRMSGGGFPMVGRRPPVSGRAAWRAEGRRGGAIYNNL